MTAVLHAYPFYVPEEFRHSDAPPAMYATNVAQSSNDAQSVKLMVEFSETFYSFLCHVCFYSFVTFFKVFSTAFFFLLFSSFFFCFFDTPLQHKP